jgi:hypothetical protein
MYKVTVNWYENYCQIDESSDFYDELFNKIGPIYNTSKEDVETQIYNLISNLPSNHYGKFEDQTEVIHKYLI